MKHNLQNMHFSVSQLYKGCYNTVQVKQTFQKSGVGTLNKEENVQKVTVKLRCK